MIIHNLEVDNIDLGIISLSRLKIILF